MPKKKSVKGSNKEQEKIMSQPSKEQLKLCRPDKVEKLKAEGWKVVKQKEGKVEGVRTHSNDLILMKK